MYANWKLIDEVKVTLLKKIGVHWRLIENVVVRSITRTCKIILYVEMRYALCKKYTFVNYII